MGLTVPSNAGLATAPSRGIVAYPAGCTVVLYNTRKNRQSHIINASRKTITSLAFSEDGRYLVTGECGHAPCVRIWDVQEKTQISEFPGHKYGVNVVVSYQKIRLARKFSAILMVLLISGIRAQWQICGVCRQPAGHDCQRVGLAKQHQGGFQQDLDQSQGHFLC